MVDVFKGERGKAGKANSVLRIGGGRIAEGLEEEVMSFTFFVLYFTKLSAVRGEGGLGKEG